MDSVVQIIESQDDQKLTKLFQEIIAGRRINTGRLRMAEFLLRQAKSVKSGTGLLQFCGAIERVLNHTNLNYFLDNHSTPESEYSIFEFIRLCSICSSPTVTRVLFRKRLEARGLGCLEEFDKQFSEDIVRAIQRTAHNPEVAMQAALLCVDDQYKKYVGAIYFSLLELSPDTSIQIVPAFTSYYFSIENSEIRGIYHKRLNYHFSESDIGYYIDRLSNELGQLYWRIVLRTDLSRRLISLPTTAEVGGRSSEMPPSQLVLVGSEDAQPYRATTDRNDTKILNAQVDEAANNPTLVKKRMKEFLSLTYSNTSRSESCQANG